MKFKEIYRFQADEHRHILDQPDTSSSVSTTFDMLGKRKRDLKVVSKPIPNIEPPVAASPETDESTQSIFRRHFEAIFEPLPEQTKSLDNVKDSDLDDISDARSEVSEWSGLSETSIQPPVIEVVNETILEEDSDAEFHRARQKAFMVRRFYTLPAHRSRN